MLAEAPSGLAPQGSRDDGAGSLLDLSEMLGTLERLGVDLVDVLRAGRPSGEPRRLSRNLQSADGSVVVRALWSRSR